jgi:hypothetical protein
MQGESRRATFLLTSKGKKPQNIAMSTILKLEIPDEVFQSLTELAAQAGQSPEDWVLAQVKAAAPTAAQRAEGLARLLRFAGSVDLGRPTGIDNAQIDADLAAEYGDSHEDRH